MKKVLLIRRTKEYFYSGKLGWEDHSFTVQLTHNWNLFFGMDYLSFRKRLVKISEESISKINFDLIIPYEDHEAVNALPPGSLLFPIDEDDWLSSSLIPEINNSFTLECLGKNLYWDVYRVWVTCNQRRVHVKNQSYVESCGYCISLPINFQRITFHGRLNKKDAHHIPKMLSLKLDSAASVGVLRRNNNDTFQAIVHHVHRATITPNLVPKEYSSYWDSYVELCKELLSSCKIPYEDYL